MCVGRVCSAATNVIFVEFLSEYGVLPPLVAEIDDEMNTGMTVLVMISM